MIPSLASNPFVPIHVRAPATDDKHGRTDDKHSRGTASRPVAASAEEGAAQGGQLLAARQARRALGDARVTIAFEAALIRQQRADLTNARDAFPLTARRARQCEVLSFTLSLGNLGLGVPAWLATDNQILLAAVVLNSFALAGAAGLSMCRTDRAGAALDRRDATLVREESQLAERVRALEVRELAVVAQELAAVQVAKEFRAQQLVDVVKGMPRPVADIFADYAAADDEIDAAAAAATVAHHAAAADAADAEAADPQPPRARGQDEQG
jgi:hypothetical protein